MALSMVMQLQTDVRRLTAELAEMIEARDAATLRIAELEREVDALADELQHEHSSRDSE